MGGPKGGTIHSVRHPEGFSLVMYGGCCWICFGRLDRFLGVPKIQTQGRSDRFFHVSRTSLNVSVWFVCLLQRRDAATFSEIAERSALVLIWARFSSSRPGRASLERAILLPPPEYMRCQKDQSPVQVRGIGEGARPSMFRVGPPQSSEQDAHLRPVLAWSAE